MASAAEQMAANLSWGQLGKATELRQRIWFTIGLSSSRRTVQVNRTMARIQEMPVSLGTAKPMTSCQNLSTQEIGE